MAKAKNQEEKNDDPILSLIKKKHGGVFCSGDESLQKKTLILPVSPKLDYGLGGGIKEGTIATFSGKPKEGKTTTALTFAANCQRPEYGSKRIFYLNAEGRLQAKNLTGIRGLKTDIKSFTLIESTEEKILSAQDYLDIAMDITKNVPGSVIIFDSFSMLCDSAEMDTGIEYQNRGGINKVVAGFIRQICQILPVQKVTLIGIVHVAATQAMFGSKWEEQVSQKVKYGADTQLEITYTKPWSTGSGDKTKEIGKEVHWKIKSSSYGQPQSDVVSYLRYNYGLDDIYEMIDLAIDFGLIDKSGAWYTISCLVDDQTTEKDVKFQGTENLFEAINNNNEWKTKIEAKLKELISGS